MRRALLPLTLTLLLSACGPGQAPDETRRPDPQAAPTAASAPAAGADTTSPITATANGYKEAARNAAAQTENAAAQEKARIDAAGQ